MRTGISFEKLPLWQGVRESPRLFNALPFDAGWDKRGFIAQTTAVEIKNRVVDSYAEEGYTYGTQPPGLSEWSNKLGELKCDFVKRTYGSVDGINIVEIGAGSLNIAERLTSQYDIGKYIVFDPAIKEFSAKNGICVFRNYFQKEKLCNENFDLILGFSVLEHIPDPVALLEDLHDILIPSQGKAILSFPDVEQQFKNGDFNVLLHEHLNYFTMSTAASLFSRCGFDVLGCESRYDTLWYYVQARHKGDAPVILPDDRLLNVSAGNFYRNIELVSQRLDMLVSQGKRVALHGACNGLNNILFLGGVKYNENILIFDGDKTKAGKYLSVYNASIHLSEEAIYKTVDKVFIAALSFYGEIKQFLIEKHGIDSDSIGPLYPDALG